MRTFLLSLVFAVAAPVVAQAGKNHITPGTTAAIAGVSTRHGVVTSKVSRVGSKATLSISRATGSVAEGVQASLTVEFHPTGSRGATSSVWKALAPPGKRARLTRDQQTRLTDRLREAAKE